MQNYVAAFKRGNHTISRLVIGEENVKAFTDSQNEFAIIHLFTDISEAEKAWDREQDKIMDSLSWS